MAIQDMLQVLSEQTEIHRDMLQIADQKKNAIIQNDVERVNQLVNKESKLIRQITELEEKRIFEVNRFVVGKGYRANPNITISDLLKIVFNGEERKKLQEAQASLAAVVGKLKEANALNQQLIEQSLQFINYSLDLIAGTSEDDAIYHHPDKQNHTLKRPGMFDTRA